MQGRTSSRRSPRPSAGTSWRAASLKPSALHVRKRRILRRLRRGPGRCCTGSARCFSVPSSCAPSQPRPGRCAQSRCSGTPMRAEAGDGLAVCRPAFSARLGATPCSVPQLTGGSGRRRPCSPCGTGCGPATSGSRAAGNGGPSRIDQLMPPALFAAMREAGPLPVAVPATAGAYLAERRALLDRRLAEVAGKAAADRLEDVRIAAGELRVSPLRAATSDDAEALAGRLYCMAPVVRITELLAEVDRWTGFGAAFTHLHTGLPADDTRIVLTAVLADATNLGLSRMADACALATYRQLVWASGWHLREETYRRALALVVNAQQRQRLAAHFGAADVSSSDGQHFPTGGPGEAVGAVNTHYGRDATTLLYTHVSARHAPFHTVAIPPSGEAAHVIDGLLYHEADLASSVHHTDGGGVSDHVFALARVLGFGFAPRIPNLAERRLYAFGSPANWPALEPFIAGRIDAKLIASHWDDVLRLAASVRTGTVSASLMLKRLGAYPRQNGLALALREIGRIERTLFTLDWLDKPDLRRQATVELNKGEARNALARAVCFHRLGRLRDRTAALQQHRASGLALVTAAIALWNTVYLGRALDALRRRGEVVSDALLAHIAPLGWQHVNLTGDYLWGIDSNLAPDGLRPLRGEPPLRAAA